MMHLTTFGDLARNFETQRQTTTLKQTLERLSYEVTTGRTADLAGAVAGDFLPINAVETAITRLDRYRTALVETQFFVETGQRALETVGDRALSTGANLITASSTADITVIEAITGDARQGFAAVVSALNSQAGGRGVFGGMAVTTAALAPAETMLADISAAIAGATSVQDVVDAIDLWFDAPGGGFETIGYTGSPNRLLPFDLGLGNSAGFDFAADDQEVREILKGFALASVVSLGTAALGTGDLQDLVRVSGEQLLTAEKQLAEYRASVGVTEAAIAAAITRNGSEKAAFEMARAEIVNIDQYGAAGELESTRVQLEMLYAVTARMSRLNLMEFLK